MVRWMGTLHVEPCTNASVVFDRHMKPLSLCEQLGYPSASNKRTTFHLLLSAVTLLLFSLQCLDIGICISNFTTLSLSKT